MGLLVETKFILTNDNDNSCSYRLCWHDLVSDHGCDFFGIGRELDQVDIFAGASLSGNFRGCKSKWIFSRVQVQMDIFMGTSQSGHFCGCKSKLTFSRVQVQMDIFAGASPQLVVAVRALDQ